MPAYDHVIRGVQEVAVEQRLWQPWPPSAERTWSRSCSNRSPCRSDLPVDRVEECKRCQQVLTRAALAPRIIPARPTGVADGPVRRQGMQPSEQVTHDGELRAALESAGHGERPAKTVYHRV